MPSLAPKERNTHDDCADCLTVPVGKSEGCKYELPVISSITFSQEVVRACVIRL